MKKIIIATLVFLSATLSAQVVKSIENKQTELIINDTISLKKGGELQVYVPASKDFIFIKRKKMIDTKLLGNVADIVGTGAAVVGVTSTNVNVLENVVKVSNTANAIENSVYTFEKIQSLPISDKAKKIAGKKMQVLSWDFTSDGYVVTAELENKKYEIYLQEAIMSGEIKL